MAIRGKEIELLGDGIRADSPTKGAFALNMLYRRNSWEVRRGFGQVVELDTTMGAIFSGSQAKVWGYDEHLGSYLMKTSFGHEQVISVFLAKVLTGDRQPDTTTPINNSTLSQFMPIYVVDIYDLTTNDRWEEPIFRHTAEFGDSPTTRMEMPDWHGHYETFWRAKVVNTGAVLPPNTLMPTAPDSVLEDRQDWLIASEPAQQFFFTELDDILYLGNKDTGLLAYIPAVFRGRRLGANNLSRRGRHKQVTTVYERGAAPPYSESSVVINAVASDGPFSDGITYLNRTEFPSPRGGGNIAGRLVLFDEYALYFSDVGYPTSVAADNVMFVPSESPITAVKQHNGNLIIFTNNETWYYQPSAGFVATTGRLVKLAEGVGCLGEGAVVAAGDSLVWMGPKGVYTLGGNLQIQEISEPIEPFFNDFISNPVTNYFVSNGELTAPIPDQTDAIVRLVGSVNAAYSQKLDAVIFSIPERNAMLYYGSGKWSLWSTDSMVTTAHPAVVGETNHIKTPWVMASEDGVYLVGSLPKNEPGQDMTALSANDYTRSRSYYVLKYGRGGAVDRSVEAVEDYREVVGRWRSVDEKTAAAPLAPIDTDHYIYFGKPVPIPQGMALGPIGGTVTTDGAVDGSMWMPIDLAPGYRSHAATYAFGGIERMTLSFLFDNTNWAPVVAPGTANIQFFLPPERQPTLGGWTATVAGNTINVDFVGAAGAWAFAPQMALQRRRLNRAIYIPFKPITSATTVGVVTTITTKTIQDTSGVNLDMRAFIWDQTRILDDRHEDNDVAQSVDWAYKSAPVKTPDAVQIKGRGLYMDVMSHGPAVPTHRLAENWPFGLLNVLSAPDTKGWSSQVVDMVNTKYPASVKNNATIGTIRTRYAQTSTSALTTSTFNNATGAPVWGDPANPMVNNALLVGDEEVSQLAVSDSVRGESFTYMVWGSIQNKAERIILGSVRAVMRVLGGKHRRGR